jgi:hypothetical protein
MKMNRMIVLLALSATASPAFADETNINITAQVNSVCKFSTSEGGVDPSTPIVLAIAQNGSHAGAAQADTSMTRSMQLSCNQPFVVHLESAQGAVRRISTLNGGTDFDTPILGGTMAKAIAYSATPSLANIDTAVFVPAYTTLIANSELLMGSGPTEKIMASNVVRADASGENSGGAYEGTLEIAIATEASPTLIAGSYRDTLRVILIAQ